MYVTQSRLRTICSTYGVATTIRCSFITHLCTCADKDRKKRKKEFVMTQTFHNFRFPLKRRHTLLNHVREQAFHIYVISSNVSWTVLPDMDTRYIVFRHHTHLHSFCSYRLQFLPSKAGIKILRKHEIPNYVRNLIARTRTALYSVVRGFQQNRKAGRESQVKRNQ